jgi:hypothetical protein
MLAAGAVVYQQLVRQEGRRSVSRTDRAKAVAYAEAGIAASMARLRLPTSASNFSGVEAPLEAAMPGGRYAVSVSRSVDDPSLVKLFSTGYFYMDGGNSVDPANGRAAQSALVESTVRTRSAASFFAAVPGYLEIGYGTDLSSATIYAAELRFAPSNGGSTPTKVYQALYHDAVLIESAGTVQYTGPGLRRLTLEPNLVSITSDLRTLYESWAGSDRFYAGAALQGVLSSPSNQFGVYYCPGDLRLAGDGTTSGSLQVQGQYVIYVAGSVTIDGPVTLGTTGAWVAVVAEGDITLSSLAPTNTELNGTYLSGRAIAAAPASTGQRLGRLTFTGGFQAQEGANMSAAWRDRTYIYQAAPSNLLLPFFLSTEDYRVHRGAYAS